MTASLSAKLRSANVLMTLLIVTLHSNMKEIYPVTVVTDMAVPTFFCISAFLYFQNWRPNRALYLKKLRSRVRSLLVPYLLYNVIFYGFYLFKTYALHLPLPKDIPTAPLDAVVCIITSVPDGPLWFIRELMVFVVVAPLFGIILKKYKYSVVALVIAGIFMAQHSGYSHFVHWIPCFATGCFLALYQDDVTRWYEACKGCLWHRLLLGNAVLPIAVVIVCCVLLRHAPVQGVPYYLYRIAAPLLVLMVYVHVDPLPGRFVRTASPYTFYAYGIHVLFVWNIHGALLKLGYVTDDGVYPLEFLFILVSTLLLIFVTGCVLRRIPFAWSPLTGFRQ